MSTEKALKQLKSVWSQAGLDSIPSPAETRDNLRQPEPGARKKREKSARTARLDLRLTIDEKRRIELMSVAAGVSINEIFSRMLALYERENGRVEITSPKETGV